MMKKMKLCLPVGWRMIKARYLFRFSRGYTIGRADMGDTGVACIHYGDIHGDYHFAIDINTARLGRIDEPLRFGVSEYVSAGQFLFAGSSEDYEGSGNFTLIRGNRSAIAGTDTIVLTPYSDMDVDYTAYLFDSLFFREQIRPHMMGTKVFHPSQKVIKSAWCIVPPQNESRQIVQYLNHEILWIDGLIEKLRREVELLEQYRREFVWDILTSGLEPNVATHESNVDWIGSIPNTWSTIPVRRLFKIVKRIEPEFSDQILSITQKGIAPKDLSSHFGQLAESYDAYQRVDVGDYAMNSMDLLTGWVDRSEYDGITSPDYRVFRLRSHIAAEPRYFTHILQMGYTRRIFYRFGQGVSNLGRWRLQPKVFLNMKFPLPPLEEQVAIADCIEDKYAEIESTVAGINRQIELLEQYRKQIINDVVTGKIRVGEVA
jgi:type I restriction modification DNA specificity domain protein